MGRVLENLEPNRVFYYFEELASIPRCSGEERKVSNYLVNFAREHDLKVIQDEALNVIITKPGTVGYENAPKVILQGHMDMVCEKESNVVHDFSVDPIAIRIDGDNIMAAGTTLGADNGIAVAMCLAILESKSISHPPLEVLVTTSEETGMGGAIALDSNNVKGKILINIDSEVEGKLLVSCAGGERDMVEIPIEWETVNDDAKPYDIHIEGLQGGHSGMEINEGRGNANILMGRLLHELKKNIDFKLTNVEGGSKTNAIPREAKIELEVNPKDEKHLKEIVEKMETVYKNELNASDSGVKLSMKNGKKAKKCFSEGTKRSVITALMLLPTGVQTMSMEIEGLVESSNNLGIVTTLDNSVTFESSIRSSIKSLRKKISSQMEVLANAIGGKWNSYASYPEWQFEENSYIRSVFQKVYKEMYGKEIEISAIHAGLECGLFKEKFGEMDMVSFGPNMYGVHTPGEALSISSTNRTWELLLNVLKEIK